jgi:DNA-binding transcriptional MerR regulator
MTELREITDDLIRASEAARLLHVSPRTLARWSESGILPEPVRVGPGELRYYYRSDVEKLLKGKGNANG